MGSWIGRDRLNEKDRNSLYQYAINAPIFVIDKRGLEVDFSAIISFTWSWGDSWNSNCVPGWSIDFGLTSAFRNNMIEPIVPVATATVSFMRNIQGTSYATNDWNVDVTFGIGVSVGAGDVSTNIKEPLMHSRDYVKGIPSYELGFSYIFLVHYNSKVDRLDRSDCGYLRRHITTHNRFSVAVPEHLSVMYQNDQSILLPITMDQDWSATLNITYKDVTLNYAQFTGNSDLKNEPDRTGGLYYTQDAYQQSLNWGTFGIILDTKEGKQHLLYDTHIGQDLIHEIIGDRSFTPKKHPGIYFGNTIFAEYKAKSGRSPNGDLLFGIVYRSTCSRPPSIKGGDTGIINYLSLHLLSTSIREEAIDATHQFRIVTRCGSIFDAGLFPRWCKLTAEVVDKRSTSHGITS